MSDTPSSRAGWPKPSLSNRKPIEELQEERIRLLEAMDASLARTSRVPASSSTTPNHASVGRSSSTIRTSNNRRTTRMASSGDGELLTPLKYKQNRYSADMSEVPKRKGKAKATEETLDDEATFVETEEDLKAADDIKNMRYTGFKNVEESKAECQVYSSELAKKLQVHDDEDSIMPVNESIRQKYHAQESIAPAIKMSDIAKKLRFDDDEDSIMPIEETITKGKERVKESIIQDGESYKDTKRNLKDNAIQARGSGKEAKPKIMDSDGIERTEETMRKLKAALVEHMIKTGFSDKECEMVCRAMKERKLIFKECKDIRNKLIDDLEKHSPGYVFKFIPAKQEWLREVRLHERLLPGVEHDFYDIRNMPFAPQYFTINQGVTNLCKCCKERGDDYKNCPYNRVLSCDDNENHPDFAIRMGSVRPIGPECPRCWKKFEKKYNFMELVKKETSYNVLVGFPTADQVIEMKNLHSKIIINEGVDVYNRLYPVSYSVESVRTWSRRYPKTYGEDNRGAARDERDFQNIVKEVGGMKRL